MFTFGYKTKFDSVTRAVAAIGIGLVMIFGANAPTLVVKIIAALLVAAGVASLIYGIIKSKDSGGVYRVLMVNACLDVLLGALLYFNPQWVAGFIVYLIGIALILFGTLQLVALSGVMSLLGAGFSSLILSACAIIGGAFLLFNPFTLGVMSVIAGCFMVIYGVSELISTWRIGKARKEYEIRRTAAPSYPGGGTPESGRIDTSGLSDAKEVDFERIDTPDDLC